jgi:orotidine-5'-phosphate decarboxylase
VGATFPEEIVRARELLPNAPFLLPGVGAQGGSPADVAAAFTDNPASALVSASRSVIYASGGDWRAAAAAEAERLAGEIWRAAGA